MNVVLLILFYCNTNIGLIQRYYNFPKIKYQTQTDGRWYVGTCNGIIITDL